MKYALIALIALIAIVAPAMADTSELVFDPAKLCAWQATNNGMDVVECSKLEDEGKAALTELEGKAEQTRKDECVAEAKSFSGDSGFASYTVYTGCLKNGPGSL